MVVAAASGGGGGPRFPKPPADAGALRDAAARLKAAAGSFAANTDHVKLCTTQAVEAPWHGNSSLAFVTASHGVQQLSGQGERAAAAAASATTTFARVVHDVDEAIDGLNRRHEQAWNAAAIAAANQPAHSTKDPYADAGALDIQLEKQYEDQLTTYNTAASGYAHALSAADLGDLWKTLDAHGKDALYPVKWALRSIAGAMGHTSSGFYDLLTQMHYTWWLLQQGRHYSAFLLRGLQSEFFSMWEWVPFLGKKAAAKAGFYRDLMTRSWRTFAIGSDELGPFATAALKAIRMPAGAFPTVGKVVGLSNRVAAPVTTLAGLHDMIWGAGHSGGRDVTDRVMGGVGFAGGAVVTASLLGLTVPPVGLAIAGGAMLGYGLYSLGSLVWDNRKAIGQAFATAGNWVGHQASDVYHKVSDEVSTTIHTITHPQDVLGSIGHAFGL